MLVVAFRDLHLELVEEVVVEVVFFIVAAVHGEQWVISLFSLFLRYLIFRRGGIGEWRN